MVFIRVDWNTFRLLLLIHQLRTSTTTIIIAKTTIHVIQLSTIHIIIIGTIYFVSTVRWAILIAVAPVAHVIKIAHEKVPATVLTDVDILLDVEVLEIVAKITLKVPNRVVQLSILDMVVAAVARVYVLIESVGASAHARVAHTLRVVLTGYFFGWLRGTRYGGRCGALGGRCDRIGRVCRRAVRLFRVAVRCRLVRVEYEAVGDARARARHGQLGQKQLSLVNKRFGRVLHKD